MPNVTAHGGLCCGRRHIYGMNGMSTADILSLMRQNRLLDGGVNKITEIVISQGDNANFDWLSEQIIGAGFVRVAVWDNCSGSECHMFLHANDWQAFPNGAAVRLDINDAIRPPAPVDDRLHVGDRICYRPTNGGNRNLIGSYGYVTGVGQPGEDVVVRLDGEGIERRFASASLAAVRPRRVDEGGAPAAIGVVGSTFHNVLATGRGAGFDTYAAARAAAPRARGGVDRRDFMSDGSVRWAVGVIS